MVCRAIPTARFAWTTRNVPFGSPAIFGYHLYKVADFRDVDPAELRLPPSRFSGADPYKLQRQVARFGASTVGMPPVWVYEGSDSALEIINSASRPTRVVQPTTGTS